MHARDLDPFDLAILRALQRDGALTNAALAAIVHLSPSQVSRRRAALEADRFIEGYRARINAGMLGYGLRAITRVNLAAHSGRTDETFATFVRGKPQVRAAYSVSGDADYVLHIHVRDLEAFADFVHRHLLPHPDVSHVRSEIVLTTLKEEDGLPLSD
ncbi:Lrp/AsnC family transcriptional regulator [Acuticoccus kandeliae]|uniref:Lrp/AsnC family transcriptional regulator n=1 Tax=Acuticoccus kandeliae TaxID=2073160 RepID=UPI000D3E1DCA|nr:Lrp/AsnC family transcriptional regulator [Acuticoccus kandeliae]